jgi:predicted Ser/Thr protein kinase
VDALCLFDARSHRIVSVNESWSRLFGYSATAAAGTLAVSDLAWQPEDLLRVMRTFGVPPSESTGRALFKRSDGRQFAAQFSLGTHDLGPAVYGTLMIETAQFEAASRGPISRTAVEDEVISQTGVPGHLKEAMRERMSRCARQQAALLRLSSLDDLDFEQMMREVLHTDSDTLAVARVSYWTLSRGGKSIVCRALYDRSKGGFESGLELFARDYPRYFEALGTGALIPAYDALTDPRTSEFAEGYLKPLGIGAMLDIPVYLRGELLGVVCHEHVGGSRGWTMDEQQFALSVGQTLSLAIAARHEGDILRESRNREALIAETNAVLERVLRPGDGRLTGKTLGRYRMGEVLGRGGMGEVYKATRAGADEPVAVKVLRKASLGNPEHVERLLREAKLTAAVPSEHVARVIEAGRFDDGAPFIAMELLEGHDLSWHLRRTPRLPLSQVVELCDHASRALAAVRDAGVVHRDLKPQNIFLVDALPRAWKVVDFGISWSLHDKAPEEHEDMAGTPQYMAPEQIAGQPTDHRTDLYALGAIAFRALAGRPPFLGDLQEILTSALAEPVPRVTELVSDLPADVDLVFAVALAKDPAERFGRVERLATALRQAAEGQLDEATRRKGLRLMSAVPGSS